MRKSVVSISVYVTKGYKLFTWLNDTTENAYNHHYSFIKCMWPFYFHNIVFNPILDQVESGNEQQMLYPLSLFI